MAEEDNDDTKKQKESAAQIAKKLELLEQEIEYTKGVGEQLALNQQIRQKEAELSKATIKETQDQIDLLLSIKKAQGALNSAQEEDLNKLIAKKLEHKEVLELLETQNQVEKEALGLMDGLFRATLGVKKQSETLVGKFQMLAKDSNSLKDIWGKLADESKQYLNTTSLASATLIKIAQSTIAVAVAQDQAVSGFNKLTGTTGEYADLIKNAAMSNKQFAVSMEDAGQAAGDLFTGMSSFSELSESTQAEVLKTTVQLDKLGVSSGVTAKNMEIATRSLGMSAGAAVKLQKELFDTATALGLPAAAVSEGFAQAAPQLAQHGEKMVGVLKGLAKESKETGIAIGNLVSIASQFNTFEGAADAAGKLNAVLGGDLINSVDLLVASEEKRIQMLQDTIKNSGKAFHEMNRFEKMAVASAAGISDMAEATALFNPQMIGMSKAARTAAERAQAVTTVAKQFQAVMASAAVIITPFLNGLKFFLDILLKIHDETSQAALGGTSLTTVIIGLAAAFALAVKMATVLTAIIGPFGPAAAAAGPGLASLAAGVTTFAAAATAAAPGFLAFGAAVLLIGLGVGAAAAGFGLMADSFSKMSAEQILATAAAMAVLTAGLVGMAYILKLMVPSTIVGALALKVFAAAIGSVALTVALASAAFGLMAFFISSAVQSFVQLNTSLLGVDFAAAATGYAKIAKEINNIANSVEKMPLAKAVALSYIMTAASVTGAAAPTEAAAGQAKTTVAALASASERRAAGSAISTAATQQTTAAPQVVVKPNIKLVIDKKELGRVLDSEIRSRIKSNEAVIAGRAKRSAFDSV